MLGFLKNIKRTLGQEPCEIIKHCAVMLMTAWCFICTLSIPWIAGNTGSPVSSLESISYINFPVHCLQTAGLFCVLMILFCAISSVSKKTGDVFERLIFFLSVFMYGIVCVILYDNVYFCLFMTGIVLLSLMYCIRGIELSAVKINACEFAAALVFLALIPAVFIGVYTVSRYLTFSSPNYDFGIFSQMFYYMKNTLTMNTTCERDVLMSHMKVHVSPDWYLLLPFYALFDSPVTLQIMQGIVLALAIFPLSKICRLRNLSRLQTLALCAVYAFYPVISSGCGYDVHENMFLPLAFLCLILVFEQDLGWQLIPAAAFALGVKEDAAVYVAFVALYMIVAKKKYKKGAAVFAAAVVYFFAAVWWLSKFGDGTLTFRYNNVILGGGGNVLGIIRTVLSNPAYVVTQIMQEENIPFIVSVLGSLAFIPLALRKWHVLILFGPFIMFNLLPDYVYAHDIGFQYVFGSGVLLLYAALENIFSMRRLLASKVTAAMAVSSVMFFAALSWDRISITGRFGNSDLTQMYDSMNEALSMIPDDASVAASSFLCAKLSKRDYLYEVYYTDKMTDYVALDLRGVTLKEASAQEAEKINGGDGGTAVTGNTDENTLKYLNSPDYEAVYYKEGCIAVLKRK